MKNFGWKHFLALFMAVVMVMASGVFVTTQSFRATEDGSYGNGYYIRRYNAGRNLSG